LLLSVAGIFLGSCNYESSVEVGADTFIFTNVDVISVLTDGVVRKQDVAIEGGRVVSISAAGSVTVPKSSRVIDGTGKFLLPGLADMHAHPFTKDDLTLYLANGVTLIRSMWGEPSLLDMRDEVEAGLLDGPRIYTGGRIVDGSTPVHFGTVPLSDPGSVAGVMKAQIDSGYDFVKIYSQLSPEVFAAMADVSRETNIEIAGHLPSAVPVEQGFSGGMRSMEHMYGFLAATLREPTSANLDLAGFDPGAIEMVNALGRGDLLMTDLISSAKFADIVQQGVSSDTWLVPTLSVLKSVYGLQDPMPDSAYYLSPGTRSMWRNFERMLSAFGTDDLVAGQRALFTQHEAMLKAVYEGGGKIMVGTDAPNPGVTTGFAVVDEIQWLADAGLGNQGALRAATLEPARYMKESDDRGHVTVGAVADLLLVNGNPLEDIQNLRDRAGVMRTMADGSTRWYDARELDAQLEEIAEESAALEGTLNAAPLSSDGQSLRSDFLSPDGEHLAQLVSRTNGAVSVEAALKHGDSWQNFRQEYTAGRSVVAGLNGEFVLSDQDGDRQLQRDGKPLLTRERNEHPALLLTGLHSDLAALHTLLATLEVGSRTQVEAWQCRNITECDDPTITIWDVKRQQNDVLDGHFYYTGVRVFEVSANNQQIGRVFIGGGAYDGQSQLIELQGADLANSMWRVR